jgi:hypothetical protein
MTPINDTAEAAATPRPYSTDAERAAHCEGFAAAAQRLRRYALARGDHAEAEFARELIAEALGIA